jgi:hypothetical protein
MLDPSCAPTNPDMSPGLSRARWNQSQQLPDGRVPDAKNTLRSYSVDAQVDRVTPNSNSVSNLMGGTNSELESALAANLNVGFYKHIQHGDEEDTPSEKTDDVTPLVWERSEDSCPEFLPALAVYGVDGHVINLPMQAAQAEHASNPSTVPMPDAPTSNNEELDSSNDGQQRTWRKFLQQENAKRYSMIALFVAVVVAAVLGGVCGTGHCFSGSSTEDEGKELSPTPTLSREEQIVDYFNQITLTGQTFTHKGPTSNVSYEQQVLTDLMYGQIDFQPDTPSNRFRWKQQYVLSTMLIPRERFQQHGVHECNWTGVECEVVDLGFDIGKQLVAVSVHVKSRAFFLGFYIEDDGTYDGDGVPPRPVQAGAVEVEWTGWASADWGLLSDLLHFHLSGSNSEQILLPDTIGLWTRLVFFQNDGHHTF